MTEDRDLRSRYVFQSDCHIVVIDQCNWRDKKRDPEWKAVTNLFVSSEEVARYLVETIQVPWKGKE